MTLEQRIAGMAMAFAREVAGVLTRAPLGELGAAARRAPAPRRVKAASPRPRAPRARQAPAPAPPSEPRSVPRALAVPSSPALRAPGVRAGVRRSPITLDDE